MLFCNWSFHTILDADCFQVSYRCIAPESPNEHLHNCILDCQTPCMYCLWRSIHLDVASTRPCTAISIVVEHHHTSEFFACVVESNALTASDTGKGRSFTPHLSLAQSQCQVGETNPQRVLLVMEVVVEMRSKKRDGGVNEGED